MTNGPSDETKIVYPSGAARLASVAPTVPPAPALLSTMKLAPSFSCSLVPSVRAIMSVDPPGGNGTNKVTGLVGQT